MLAILRIERFPNPRPCFAQTGPKARRIGYSVQALIKRYSLQFQGRCWPLSTGETTLGRSRRCGVILGSPLASREHAVVQVDEDKVFLQDGGSTNGTTVNGERVAQRREVRPGDRIGIGADILKLCEHQEQGGTQSGSLGAGSEEVTCSIENVSVTTLVSALLEECLRDGSVRAVLPQLRETVDKHIGALQNDRTSDSADSQRDGLRRLISSFRTRVPDPDFQVWSEAVVSRLR